MLLLVNNISSYFDKIRTCLNTIGVRYAVKRYDELDGSAEKYDGIILSGRMNSLKSMNVANMNILRSAYKEDRPVLGICYGAEIMALTFDGSLKRLNERVIGDNEITIESENLLTNRRTLTVFESHGYDVARLPKGFTCMAYSANCRYEMIGDANKHFYGMQFHPEVSKDGMELIRNFVNITKN